MQQCYKTQMKLNTFSNDNSSTGNVMSDIFLYFWIKREQYVLCSISIFNPLKNIVKKYAIVILKFFLN